MPNKDSRGFTFVSDFFRALFAIVCLSVTLIAAEVYLSNGHMLADAEIENGCAPCSASVALATIKHEISAERQSATILHRALIAN
jgi:hypothetical protein